MCQAIDAYNAVLAIDPKNPSALLGLACAMALSGDFKASIKQFTRVIKQHPDKTDGYVGRAQVLMASNEVGW